MDPNFGVPVNEMAYKLAKLGTVSELLNDNVRYAYQKKITIMERVKKPEQETNTYLLRRP